MNRSPKPLAARRQDPSRRAFSARWLWHGRGVRRLLLPRAPEAAETSAATYLLSTDKTDDPLFMSTTKIAALIRAKKISSVEAVKLCYNASTR